MNIKPIPNGKLQVMREEDFIVSKTDLKGRITYANRIFLEFAQYTETELLGTPHSIVRHPDMPRAVFKLLWDTIERGNEIFAYVLNMAKDGSGYWVFANITPVKDEKGSLIGYYSVRRKPKKNTVEKVIPIYKSMLEEERRHSAKDQIAASSKILTRLLEEKGMTYEEFILSI